MGRIVAEKSGAVLSTGDRVKVQTSSIDLPTRQMEVRIIEMPDKHIEYVIEPPVTRSKKKRGGKKLKSQGKGRGRKRK